MSRVDVRGAEAGAAERDLVPVDRRLVERDAAGAREADVDVGVAGHGERRRRLHDVRDAVVRPLAGHEADRHLRARRDAGAGDLVSVRAGLRRRRAREPFERERYTGRRGQLVAVDARAVDGRAERHVDRKLAGSRVCDHGEQLGREERDRRAGRVEVREAAADVGQHDVAAALRAGREVAERVARAALRDQDRRLCRVERDRARCAAPGCDRELGRGVGDRRDVDAAGVRRGGERHVDEAAAVERADAGDAAGVRIGEIRRELRDREGVGLREVPEAERVHGAARPERVCAVRDGDRAGRKLAAQVVAEDRRVGQLGRCRVGKQLHGADARAAECELRSRVGDRREIQRVAGRRDELHVDVVDVGRRDAVDGEVLRRDRPGEGVRRPVGEAVAAGQERDRDRAARVGAGRPVAEDRRVRAVLADVDRRLGRVNRERRRTGDRELGRGVGDRRVVECLPARRGERDVDVALRVQAVPAEDAAGTGARDRRGRAEHRERLGRLGVRVVVVGEGARVERHGDRPGRERAVEVEAVAAAAEGERRLAVDGHAGCACATEREGAGGDRALERRADGRREGHVEIGVRREERHVAEIERGRDGRNEVRPGAGLERDVHGARGCEGAAEPVRDARAVRRDLRREALVDRDAAEAAAAERELVEAGQRRRVDLAACRERERDADGHALVDEARDLAGHDRAEVDDRRAGRAVRRRAAATRRPHRPGAARERDADVAAAHGQHAGHVVAHRVAVREHLRRCGRIDLERADPGAAERELIEAAERSAVDAEPARNRERNVDRLRALVDRRRQRPAGDRAEQGRERRAARHEDGGDVARGEAAGDPVPHDARALVDDDRSLGRVDGRGAGARPGEREDRRERRDLAPVDRVAGRGRRQRHVDVAAAVQRVDVDAGAAVRRDDVRGRAEHGERVGLRRRGVAVRVLPTPLCERHGHRSRREHGRGGGAGEVVAEVRDVRVLQRQQVGVHDLPVAVEMHDDRRRDQRAGVRVGDHRDRNRAGERDRLAPDRERRAVMREVGGVERLVVERRPRRRRVGHVDVVRAADAVDRGIHDLGVDRRAVERSRNGRLRSDDGERAAAGAARQGRVAPGAGRERHVDLAERERTREVVAVDVRARNLRRRDGGDRDREQRAVLREREVTGAERRGGDRLVRGRRQSDVEVRRCDVRQVDRGEGGCRVGRVSARGAARGVDERPAVRVRRQRDAGRVVRDDPVAIGVRRRVDEDRQLRRVERNRPAGRVHGELVREVGDRGVVESFTARYGIGDVDEAAAVQLALCDRAAVRWPTERRCRARGRRIRDGERDLVAVRVLEAHLELAVERQDPHLVGHVGQEEHGDGAGADVREVCVEAAADAEVVVGEVQRADHEDLPVGRDLDGDLAVEELLRRVDRVDRRRAGDRHRRRECRGPAVHRRVRLERQVLLHDLRSDGREPVVDGDVRRRGERCTA